MCRNTLCFWMDPGTQPGKAELLPLRIVLSLTGSDADEKKVKECTSASLRCIPFEQPQDLPRKCLMTGQEASEVAIFAKAY